MLEVIKALENCLLENIPCVEVTVIDVSGSVPGKIGFKMLSGLNGRIAGTVGGGSAEFYALKKSKELLNSRDKYLTEVLIMNDTLKVKRKKKQIAHNKNVHLNSLCGGEVTLFFEAFKKNKTIHIFGAGHVAQCLIKFAEILNYFVKIYDNRENILSEIPDTSSCKKYKIDLQKLAKAKNEVIINKDESVVILTHNHVNDLNVLEYVYKNFKGLKYIGMIGSKRKIAEGIDHIKKKLGSHADLSNLYAPIGINIGGETPAEIALSIMAEIQAVSLEKQIKHLKTTK